MRISAISVSSGGVQIDILDKKENKKTIGSG
jgi:hypothetical protein